MDEIKYTGERLVSGEKTLWPMRVENLARYQFFASRIRGQRILDLGCGDGEGTGYLRNFCDWSVFSIDVAVEAIDHAHKVYSDKGEGLMLRMDARTLAFKECIFDGIISVEVIEHIENPDIYLSEASRVLQNEGIFILSTPNRIRTAPPKDKGSVWRAHVREYTPNELLEMTTRHFSHVELWGEQIPIYETNALRKIMGKFAPLFKKILPHYLRIRVLPALQYIIKPHLDIADVEFSLEKLQQAPTIVAVCKK